MVLHEVKTGEDLSLLFTIISRYQ